MTERKLSPVKAMVTYMNVGPVIAAYRDDATFDAALKSTTAILFDLAPDINCAEARVARAHNVGKRLFIHLDLATGIGKDESGIIFMKKLGVDGIISTRTNIIKLAREHGMFSVQRVFILDSHSIVTSLESLRASRADMIEIMPGIIPRVIRSLHEKLDIPIIAGGLIESEADVEQALKSGAAAVSTSRTALWEY